MQTVTDFLAEVDAFLARSGMSASAFGRNAVNDPNFLADIRSGRSPSLRLVQKANDFIHGRELLVDDVAEPERASQ